MRRDAGAHVLDLMSSHVSHLPKDVKYGRVVGHGMNPQELSKNPQLNSWFVRNLNQQARPRPASSSHRC